MEKGIYFYIMASEYQDLPWSEEEIAAELEEECKYRLEVMRATGKLRRPSSINCKF